MRIVAFAIICLLPQIGFPAAAAAATFALGAVRQATLAAPREYVVEVDVAADGYSTFSANIVGDTDAMRLIQKWEAVEREQGVDVVITTTETIETPRIITLIAQYQGRERAGRYWLQPVISAPEEAKAVKEPKQATEKAIVSAMAEKPEKIESGKIGSGKIGSGKIGSGKIGSEKIGSETTGPETTGPVCPYLIVREGSLMANVKRLTAHCGHRLGTWYPGNSQDLVDWVVETVRLLENNQGAAGLLNMLKQDYGLLGVMRSEGSDRYIDYYELPGGQ